MHRQVSCGRYVCDQPSPKGKHMSTSRIPRWILVLTVFAALAAACGDDDDTSSTPDETSPEETDDERASGSGDICDAEPVSIVHLTDVVGESDTAIDDFWNGSTFAAEEINAECGTEIVTLERIPTDFSVEGFESKLLEAQEKEPTAIIGQGSSSQIALNSIVDEGGIPLLWPVGTEDGLLDGENGSEWAWMVRVVNDTQGLVWGTHLASLDVERVWLECVQTQLGVSGCGRAEPILEDAGIEIVGRNDSAPDESDFTNSILDLRSADADAVLLAQFPRPTIAFAQQMEDANALDRLMFGSTSTEVIYQALSEPQQDATIALADCNPREDDTEANDAYVEEYGADMTSLAAVAYDSVYLLVDAAARTGGTDPDSIADGLSSTEWDGVCQEYYDSGSHALAHRMVVTSFGGGEITTEEEYELDERGDGLAE